MDPGWMIWKYFLVGAFEWTPGWVVWKDFWLETVMVRRSGDQMEFLLGGQKKDAARSTRRFWGQGMCGLGVWWAWWAAG